MTKHLIKNYDQVKLRLADLTKQHHRNTRDYHFAVGDLFNQNVPPASSKACSIGMSVARYQQLLSKEIDQLLEDTGAEFTRSTLAAIRYTARAWDKSERTFDVPFAVYQVLAAHKDLIRDGMTVTAAHLAVHNARRRGSSEFGASSREVAVRLQSDRDLIHRSSIRGTFNPTQRLRVTTNQLHGQLAAIDEDHGGWDFTDEDRRLIREMYETLDGFVEQHGISPVELWEDAA